MKMSTRLYIVNRDSVKCSYKAFFQIYCSRFDCVHVLFFSQYTLEKVQKTSRFGIVLIYPQKTYMKSSRSGDREWGIVSFFVPWDGDQTTRKKHANPRGMPPGGGHGNRSNQVSSMDILRVRFFTKIQIRVFNPKTGSSSYSNDPHRIL